RSDKFKRISRELSRETLTFFTNAQPKIENNYQKHFPDKIYELLLRMNLLDNKQVDIDLGKGKSISFRINEEMIIQNSLPNAVSLSIYKIMPAYHGFAQSFRQGMTEDTYIFANKNGYAKKSVDNLGFDSHTQCNLDALLYPNHQSCK